MGLDDLPQSRVVASERHMTEARPAPKLHLPRPLPETFFDNSKWIGRVLQVCDGMAATFTSHFDGSAVK